MPKPILDPFPQADFSDYEDDKPIIINGSLVYQGYSVELPTSMNFAVLKDANGDYFVDAADPALRGGGKAKWCKALIRLKRAKKYLGERWQR